MRCLELPENSSPEDVGLAVYEKVQELTHGKAGKAAYILTAITCLELNGRALPAQSWCALVLCSLADLAAYAPDVKLTIPNWAVHYVSIDRWFGEASADDMTSALMWAGTLWRNVELEILEMPMAETGIVAGESAVPYSRSMSDNQLCTVLPEG